MHAQGRAYKHSHTSIYTSNLLVMRSVLSLELREKREDMKDRRKRDERRRGKQRKSHVMFSHWRSGCVGVCTTVCVHSSHLHHPPIYLMYLVYLCTLQFKYILNGHMYLKDQMPDVFCLTGSSTGVMSRCFPQRNWRSTVQVTLSE